LAHPDLTARHNLAAAYRFAGRLQEAIPLYERTLSDREPVLGADHPQTLSSRNNLANAYRLASIHGRRLKVRRWAGADRYFSYRRWLLA
jgi:hypothetical protein